MAATNRSVVDIQKKLDAVNAKIAKRNAELTKLRKSRKILELELENERLRAAVGGHPRSQPEPQPQPRPQSQPQPQPQQVAHADVVRPSQYEDTFRPNMNEEWL